MMERNLKFQLLPHNVSLIINFFHLATLLHIFLKFLSEITISPDDEAYPKASEITT